MKGTVFVILALVFTIGLSAQVYTCKDIQYTTATNGNSNYVNQDIQVRGIVTAFKPGVGLYIGDPIPEGEDGKWRGLYIHDAATSNAVQLGDMVRLSGRVLELNSFTQLRSVTSFVIESGGNAVPMSIVTAADIPFSNSTSEPWEGVHVRINNAKINSAMNLFGQVKITDVGSSVEAMIDNELYIAPSANFVVGDVWYQIQGVVEFITGDGYRILPRSAADLIKEDSIAATKISLQSKRASLDQVTSIEVRTTKLLTEWGVMDYTMTLQMDPGQVLFQGVEISGTLSTINPTYVVSGNLVTIVYDSSSLLVAGEGESVLLKILLEPIAFGNIPIMIQSFKYNDTPMSILENATVSVMIDSFSAYLAINTVDVTTSSVSKKNIFDPTMNQKVTFKYGTKGGFLARAIIRVYDAQGRLVATPLHENFTGMTTVQQIGELIWNGRDSNLKPLAPGTYYCHLEVSNRENGDRARTVQPLVVKSRLK